MLRPNVRHNLIEVVIFEFKHHSLLVICKLIHGKVWNCKAAEYFVGFWDQPELIQVTDLGPDSIIFVSSDYDHFYRSELYAYSIHMSLISKESWSLLTRLRLISCLSTLIWKFLLFIICSLFTVYCKKIIRKIFMFGLRKIKKIGKIFD